ncbi:MAG: IS110 family transposase [Bacteroidetes bacterium]|nr:IS110 family transposase [Bacteroidota bacterium]
MKHPQFAVGIDISADDFTVSISESPGTALYDTRTFNNNLEGFKELKSWFMNLKIKPKNMIICMEATGVYGEHLCYFLHENKYTIAVDPPLKVKRAFKIDGHKTDAVDSLQIAEYALRFFDKLCIWEPREDIVEKMKALITTRELLVKQKTAASNSVVALNRKAVRPAFAIKVLKSNVNTLARKIKALEKEMENLIDQKPDMRQSVNILKSVPGVKLLLAANMLVITNGFHSVKHHKQMASFLKIAPLQHQSGSSIFKKPKTPKYGPAVMRKLLHLAARSLVTHNPDFQNYYLRKQAEGKEKKLIINNVENKLVKIMCALIRDHKPFIKHYIPIHPHYLKIA